MARKWDLAKIYEILYFYSSDGSNDFLAFQRINLKHNLDQLIPQSKVLQSEISDEDSGSHSMDSNPAQGKKLEKKNN